MLRALSEHLFVHHGIVNVGVIHQGEEALIIEIGDGEVLDALEGHGIHRIEGVLFTHHHRDLVYGASRALEKGAWIGAPEAERALFEDVERYWQDPAKRWHLYYFRPNNLLSEPLPVHKGFVDGETLDWGPAHITALSTPGHTDGSMSYLVDVDGRRFIFCGDLIYDKGKILEVYSMQKGFNSLTDYHGFMYSWHEVISSLRRILGIGKGVLIPSHGNIMYEPEEAIKLLEGRAKRCYENYLSTSALWHYFPDLLSHQTSIQPLSTASLKPPPPFTRHIGTSWILIGEDRSALAMDCGGEEIIKGVEEWIISGEIKGVDGLWITHIHDDHTDSVARFRESFKCDVIAERSVAQVVSQPSAWKLPCLSPNAAPVDRVVNHRESWQWKEFTLTAYHFPGQSLYHSGLLVEGKGLRLFFCGDSFTPTGLDDYCAYNRNLLGENKGYDFCLRLLEELQPDLVFNSHIDKPFTLTLTDLRVWRESLKERWRLLRELLPWDDPNFGIDPYWTFCYPYEQRASRGRMAEVEVIITNHLPHPALCGARIIFPVSWKVPQSSPYVRGEAKPGKETRLSISFQIPLHIPCGRYVLFIDVQLNERLFPRFSEFVVEVES